MTLSNLVSTGSGRLAARWEIEGLPIEFVTEPSMEATTADGKRRLCVTSLAECGFAIEESANLPEAMLEAQGTNLLLWETLDEDLAAVFHFRPDVERFGDTGIDDTTLSITGLYSTDGIAADDVIHIGTEAMLVDSVAATSITLAERAYWGTAAQYHYSSDTGGHPDLLITNRPVRIRGRRVKLWLYGDGDDLLGFGFQRWIGVVNAEPELSRSGTVYRLSLGPITECLKTKIGGDLDTPARPRGIYYPATAALRIQIMESGSSNPFGHFTGFFESQVAFTDQLTTWLATFVADEGLDSTYVAESTPDGRWTIKVVVGASTTAVAVFVLSEQDGESSARAQDMRVGAVDGPSLGFASVSPGNVLYTEILPTTRDGHRGGTVPRGFWGHSTDLRLHVSAASYPHDRIYLDGSVDSSWSSVAVDWPGVAGTRLHTIAAVDTSSNYADLNRAPRAFGESLTPPGYLYTAPLLPTLKVLRTIATGTLADMRAALIVDAIRYSNRGTTPFVLARDLATWADVVNRAAVFTWQRERFYAFASSVDLEEFLAHECRLLGLFPVTDTEGKIALAELDLPSGQTTTAFDIDEEIARVDGQAVELSSMARGNQTVNRVKLWIGYDPREDSWPNWREVQDMTSFALDHQDRLLEIKPRSWSIATRTGGDDAIDAEELHAVVSPVLSLFGYPHEFIRVKVTWKAFDVRLGDAVTFAASHLPDYTAGARPIATVKALVVGRKWDLAEAHGELTLLLSWLNVAGYAPTARVASQVNSSGDIWVLTIDTSFYFASGEDPTDHFAAGDLVRILPIDDEAASSSVVTGTVTATSATTITVEFDATWTPGGSTWELTFTTYSLATNAGQTDYAFLAGLDLVLGSGDAARTLAP